MIRKFLIRAATASTDPNFSLDSLESAGRMDFLCRCISDAVFVSGHMRNDTIVYAVLEGPPTPPMAITFDTGALKNMEAGEKQVALAVKEALGGKPHPGITAEKKSFEAIIKEEAEKCDLVYFTKKGEDIRKVKFSKDTLFIIGGHTGVPSKTEKFIDRFKPREVMVSPAMVFSSHCIILAHNEIDRQSKWKE